MTAKNPPSPKAKQAETKSLLTYVSILFFISGGTGLAYQVIWFKRFAHVWGSSSLAFAAVAASFLLGLGLGAYLWGRVTDRLARPLQWYGICEVVIGLLALVIPYEIAWLLERSTGLYDLFSAAPLWRFIAQCGMTFLIVGPSCVLMGGTLPLLIRQCTARDGSIDESTGWLYAVNTLGAATGCYMTGFYVLPMIGLLWTNNITAAINLILGVGAIVLSIGSSVPVNSSEPRAKSAGSTRGVTHDWSSRFALWSVYLASMATGCAALGLEMTWTRQLALVLGGSTYAYTSTLFVVLIGIAWGSLIFHTWLRPIASHPLLLPSIIVVLLLTTLAGKWLLPTLSSLVGSARDMRADQSWNALICIAASAALELIPSIGMGVLFPLLVHLTQESALRVGKTVGNIYAWNTLGSILGASLTAVLAFPALGTNGSLALAGALYLVALLVVIPWRTSGEVTRGLVSVVLCGLLIAGLYQPTDPRLTNLGMYMYGPQSASQLQLEYFREGPSCNVMVTSSGNRGHNLRVNGKVDASEGLDMVTQLGSAYFPRMFKPDAKEVLIIGFGSGTTMGASLLFPGTRVTGCEIEPAVYYASKYFAKVNHSPENYTREALEKRNAELPADKRLSEKEIEEAARFSMVFGDGRTMLQTNPQKYDLIISEPSNPWLAGVSNLFTTEFFASARDHLTEDGVLAQWIQTYHFTINDYLVVVRTLLTAFPHFGVITFAGGNDTILLASRKPLMPDREKLEELQKVVDASPKLSADLKKWFATTDVRACLLRQYAVGEAGVRNLLESNPNNDLNTDLNLHLEFASPLHLFRDVPHEELATVAMLSSYSIDWTNKLAKALGISQTTPEYELALAGLAAEIGQLDEAVTHCERAIKLAPREPRGYEELITVLTRQERRPEIVEVYHKLLELKPKDAEVHAGLAQHLAAVGRPAEAIEEYRKALELAPLEEFDADRITWANNLAWTLATCPDPKVRDGDEALKWATLVYKIDGGRMPEFLDTLAASYAEVGRFDDAKRVAKQVLQFAEAANHPDSVKTARARLKSYEASRAINEP